MVTVNSNYYNREDVEEYLKTYRWKKCKQRGQDFYYYNVACAFDIETSSFMSAENEKTAVMYLWQFGINGIVWYGRNWSEFQDLIHVLSTALETDDNTRLCVYVHNLAYEFQFMRLWLEWAQVFSVSDRKVAKAVTTSGIEFRCSYILSGYKLEKLAEQLQVYHVTKAVGDLDYSKVRHPQTPLTQTEINYGVRDVLVVMAYIQEKIDRGESIVKIPLTKTGYVRKLARVNCFNGFNPLKRTRNFKEFYKYIHSLNLTSEEYKQLKRAFMGGFTHGSCYKSGKVYQNVASFDFTSSYPYVMLACTFPNSSGEWVTPRDNGELIYYLNHYHCIFDFTMKNVTDAVSYEHYISASKCTVLKNAKLDNGRVISADELTITITELDLLIIKRMYHCNSSSISNMIIYKKGYLPKNFIETILELYRIKTELKGVEGKEIEYLSGKENINALYGMEVTDIVRPIERYDNVNGWSTENPDIDESIEKYNSSKKRFLFYPVGVYITAWARFNLFSGILEFGESGDFIYSDTDSIKVLNYKNHMDYINRYNNIVVDKLTRMCNHYNIDIERTRPCTVKGVQKQIGIWDFEGVYDRFKFLRAKCYMTYENGKLSITVSGLNKKIAVPYLLDQYNGDIDAVFNAFSDGLYVPPEFTGKMTHTYIDEPRNGVVTDYTGMAAEYHEKSVIHLSNADYHLRLSQEYRELLNVIGGILQNEI